MYRCTTSTMNSLAKMAALLLVCGFGVSGLSGCEPSPSDASPNAEGAEGAEGADDAETTEAAPIPVETLTVRTRSFTEVFDVPATAEPLDTVIVAAEAAGRILTAPFEEGDEIRAGGRLLRVDTELDSARINLLEAQLESAQREYERTKKLQEKGLATPAQLDQAEDTLENAGLSLDQAKIGASKGGVQSPVSGIVLTKHVNKGEFASPGQPIATIIQYDQLIVKGQVPESRISYVDVGDTVQIEFPARKISLEGQVSHRALTSSPRTGTYAVEVTIDNADRRLLPGMSARMKIVKRQWDEAIMVPREAILQGFSRSEAMVLPAEGDESKNGELVGEAELRVVELGPSDGPNVVISSGLSGGERLIIRGHRGLVNGALARRVRHFDSIEQMRTSGAAIDLAENEQAESEQAESEQAESEQSKSKKTGTQGNSPQSEGTQSETSSASEGKAQ